jgi:hypothetical protein
MARDVLRWDASATFGESGFVAPLLVIGEFAFGVRMEVGAIAAQGEHQKKLRVQARRGNVIRCEAVDGGG